MTVNEVASNSLWLSLLVIYSDLEMNTFDQSAAEPTRKNKYYSCNEGLASLTLLFINFHTFADRGKTFSLISNVFKMCNCHLMICPF